MEEIKFKVKELNPELQEACLERGHTQGEVVFLTEAIYAWSAFHLGDGSWGEAILYHYQNPTKQ